MKHHIIHPSHDLRDYVKYFWVLEDNRGQATSRRFQTIADGSPGMIFHESENGSLYQFEKQLPPTFLYGQTTSATEIKSPPAFRAIGIYLYPHALKTIFGLPASELTNTCVDVTMLNSDSKYLTERLIETNAMEDKISVLSTFLKQQIACNSATSDVDVMLALSIIYREKGAISLCILQEKTGLSERALERRFQRVIGISPLQFCRIVRFQSSLTQLRENGFEKLSDIAYENQYADQSHFIRSFKEFAGDSPFRFRKKSSELINNFPEIIG
ncbi:helix-turn-helix domain-containing protein [Dyadobacter sp. CY343]|uniref:AraC family transcriptional regulator n=1 Tax=Dyadobacter sp. CY343 TaxID=2907299 RepID=UPI001F2DA18D|nr:helix-turn-helix domain-containing protein [Dyadobacter sp. CY343]MCE7060839.1 helix-turn-helix domain-containing protein [Dyadobacter sp. CY343]